MSSQDEHIKILKELATLDPGTFMMGKGQYHVKTSASDIIKAGERLESLGIFNFDGRNENEKALQLLKIRDSIIDIYHNHFRKKENILIFEGGSRSGKTNNIVRDIVLDCYYRGEEWNIIAPSYKMLNMGSFIDIKDFIEEFDIECKMPENATKIKFTSGGSITFEVVVSQNEAKRNRKNVYINEADGILKEIADLIIGRAKGRTIIDYNPTKKFWSEKYKTETNTLVTTWKHNPYLSENQLAWFERLKKEGEHAEIGSPERYVYEVYYLGLYSSLAMSVFQSGCFKFWDEIPDKFDHVFSYADPSLGVGNDYFAAGLFGVVGDEDYLIDSVFSQYETAETYLKTMKKWDKLFTVDHFIETNGLGKLIFNKIKNNYSGELVSVSNNDSKQGDIILYSPEAKQILMNKSKVTEEIIKQCVAFPDAEHDDAPDLICRSRKVKEKFYS